MLVRVATAFFFKQRFKLEPKAKMLTGPGTSGW